MIFLVGVYSENRKAAGVVESVCGLGWQWASSFFSAQILLEKVKRLTGGPPMSYTIKG